MGYVSTVSPYIFVTKIFVHCSKKLCLLHCCFVLFQLKVSLETFLHLVLRYPVEFMHQNQCIYDQRKKKPQSRTIMQEPIWKKVAIPHFGSWFRLSGHEHKADDDRQQNS